MENKEILRVEHLKQYFDNGDGGVLKAVDDVSFSVNKGEVFGIVGESGCGKTTTGRSIIKLYQITGGDVYFNGQRISAGITDIKESVTNKKKEIKEKQAALKASGGNQKDIDALNDELANFLKTSKEKIASAKKDNKAHPSETNIQMIFQDPMASLNPRMTVKEIIAEGLRIRGEKNEEVIDAKVLDMLDLVGLVPEHAGRYPHEFSGGQRQRIGIARAIIMEPELIIADEPISALDVSIQAQVINLLDELRHKMGLTILFIAHDLSVVKYFSDRIGVMYFGKMVELASSDELFAHPLHPYTKSLLSAIPLPDPHYEKRRKRIAYVPDEVHDYSKQQPSLREVSKDHFVNCNDEEFEKYQKELGL